MTSLLFLSTRDGQTNLNYNNFWTISLPRMNHMRGFRLALQNVEFVNAVYPINSNNQNVYFSESGGATKTAVLTPNGYTGAQMATELKTQLESANGTAITYTVTYDSQSKKFTITPSAGTIAFIDGVLNAYEELGFDSSNLAATAASQTSDFPVNLAGSRYVDVITNFAGHNHSVSTTSNVLVRVPLGVAFGEIVFYEPHTDDALFVNATQLNEVHVQLRDEKGYMYELPTNAHLSLTLKVQPVFDN